MKIRYLIRKYLNPNFKLLSETAFHEAGHVVFSYFAGFSVEQVEISNTNIGNGKSTINFGEAKDVVEALFDLEHNPATFNTLHADRKSLFKSTSAKLIHSLIGGPLAEARFIALREKQNDTNVIIENSDYKMCLSIERSVNNILANQRLSPIAEYTRKQVEKIGDAITLDEIWSTIKDLAQEILNSKKYNLNRVEIENVLERNNYFRFINNIPSR